MAVYTDVAFEDLESLLADYAIGEAKSFKGIAEGVENSNYLLQTTQGPFFLTLYERRVKPADLPFWALATAMSPAQSGATALVPPMGMVLPSTRMM